MRVKVMSQFEAEKYCQKQQNEHSFMISITSLNQDYAKVYKTDYNKIDNILKLSFDDTDNGFGISHSDTRKIKELLSLALDNVDLIIIHCGAGQSRSAGVAAAILKYLYNDDSQIFNNARYTPNMRCYRTLLNTLMEE